MTTESFEAWILHKYPSGDTSLRVSFFTREKGIINCLYKGGRTPKKQAILQPFLPLWLAIDARKDYYFVRQVELHQEAIALTANSLFAGLYVNEIIFYALSPLDPHPELFEIYQPTLMGLASINDNLAIEVLLRRFEWVLLQTCGYSLSFTHEMHSTIPIDANRYYQFIPGEGFMVASSGISGRHILALTQAQFTEISVLKTAKFIMRQAIDHLLEGRELKSRSLYPRNL